MGRAGEAGEASLGGVGCPSPWDRDNLRLTFWDVVFGRRDVRSDFVEGEVSPEVLARLLKAAHAAPSVGYSQPWDFIVVRDRQVRKVFKEHVEECRRQYMEQLEGKRRDLFSRLRIEGILESALGIVVTYDPARGGPLVLGRYSIDDAGLYSVCLAIQNLWLAARAEGLGVGWVSFYEESFLQRLLGIPEGVRPVAWLCIGPVSRFREVPELESAGWASRLDLRELVHSERWGAPCPPELRQGL
jgi:5,6-dimethylbenzimidazole synthase